MPETDPTRVTPPRPPAGDTDGSQAGDPTAPWRSPPGRIGRYEARGVLGDGGFGRVYRGFDPDLGREVAIKIPHPAGLTPDLRERFLREARAAATIHHPNVCPIYDVGTDGDVPFIVMRFVPGGTLADRLGKRDGPLPDRQVAGVVRKLALGVAAAHAAGVVHRDIKPQNVLWDEAAKEVLVTDFGLARVGESGLTRTGDVLGTPAYMAPEQWKGDPAAVGPAADVYALGVILYRMLTGDVPYRGTGYEVMAQAVTGSPRPPSGVRPGVTPALEAVCLRAMAADPAARYSSAKALADALGEFLQDRSPPPAPPRGADRPPPPAPSPDPPAGRPLTTPSDLPPEDPPPPPRTRAKRTVLVAALLAAGLLGGCALAAAWVLGPPGTTQTGQSAPPGPAPAGEPDPARRAEENLKRIVAAIDRYQVEHGKYPSDMFNPVPGVPAGLTFSWRVAILPQLGEADLYARFNWSEPWDGPGNKKLIPLMPRVYQGSVAAADGKTAFNDVELGKLNFKRRPWGEPHVFITDGTANTIAVVEAGTPVEWTRQDALLYFDRPAEDLVPPGGGDALLVGMFDGTVRRISLSRNSPDAIRRAIDPNDGNPTPLVE